MYIMPKPEELPRQRWTKNSPIAAQLFRDIFFGKYQRDSKGKFNALEVHFDQPNERMPESLVVETFLCKSPLHVGDTKLMRFTWTTMIGVNIPRRQALS